MNRISIFLSSILVAPVLIATASATAAPGDLYVYPAGEQTTEQTERDRYECYVWASKEVGFDPMQDKLPEGEVIRVPIDKNQKQGATLIGTVIGAIAGAAIGSNSRSRHGSNTAEGAFIGATAGTMIGAAIEQDGRNHAESAAQEKAESISQDQSEIVVRESNYRRAFSACLEGRGYVVR